MPTPINCSYGYFQILLKHIAHQMHYKAVVPKPQKRNCRSHMLAKRREPHHSFAQVHSSAAHHPQALGHPWILVTCHPGRAPQREQKKHQFMAKAVSLTMSSNLILLCCAAQRQQWGWQIAGEQQGAAAGRLIPLQPAGQTCSKIRNTSLDQHRV